jgi:hypothetical protein
MLFLMASWLSSVAPLMNPNPGISVICKPWYGSFMGFLVTPGRFPAGSFLPVSFLIRVDFPTFDRPTNNISFIVLILDFIKSKIPHQAFYLRLRTA